MVVVGASVTTVICPGEERTNYNTKGDKYPSASFILNFFYVFI